MANITPKPNGKYLVRVSRGFDATGKHRVFSRIFTPSRSGLIASSLKKKEKKEKKDKSVIAS